MACAPSLEIPHIGKAFPQWTAILKNLAGFRLIQLNLAKCEISDAGVKKLLACNAPEVILRNERRLLQQAVDALFDNDRCAHPVLGASKRPLKSLAGIAAKAYGAPSAAHVVPAPGTQILLPLAAGLVRPGRALVLSPTYSEHARAAALAVRPESRLVPEMSRDRSRTRLRRGLLPAGAPPIRAGPPVSADDDVRSAGHRRGTLFR